MRGFFDQILLEHDVPVITKGMKLPEARAARAAAVDSLIKKGEVGTIFDALLLDEAQDYSPNEIRIFRALTKTLVATSDTRQKIYSVEDSAKTLSNCIDQIYELKYHFRNGHEICRLADGIMSGKPGHTPLLKHSSYNEAKYPSSVTTKVGFLLLIKLQQ